MSDVTYKQASSAKLNATIARGRRRLAEGRRRREAKRQATISPRTTHQPSTFRDGTLLREFELLKARGYEFEEAATVCSLFDLDPHHLHRHLTAIGLTTPHPTTPDTLEAKRSNERREPTLNDRLIIRAQLRHKTARATATRLWRTAKDLEARSIECQRQVSLLGPDASTSDHERVVIAAAQANEAKRDASGATKVRDRARRLHRMVQGLDQSPAGKKPAALRRRVSRRLRLWERSMLDDRRGVTHTTIAPWRDVSILAKTYVGVLALHTFGPVKFVTINLGRELEVRFRQEGFDKIESEFLDTARPILQKALGRDVMAIFKGEEADDLRPHLHGFVVVFPGEEKKLRAALREAAGEWDPNARCRQIKLSDVVDSGAMSYALKDLGPGMRFPDVAMSQPLRQVSKRLYGAMVRFVLTSREHWASR